MLCFTVVIFSAWVSHLIEWSCVMCTFLKSKGLEPCDSGLLSIRAMIAQWLGSPNKRQVISNVLSDLTLDPHPHPNHTANSNIAKFRFSVVKSFHKFAQSGAVSQNDCRPLKGSNQNTSRPRQNRHCFADDIFKWIFLNENIRISINISLKYVPKGQINNILALV